MKKSIIAIIVVFIVWNILDFLIHNIILSSTYAASAELWRAEEDMMMGLMLFVTLVSSACFVFIYDWLIKQKSVNTGLKFGLLMGIGVGISMGYGTYSVQPILYFTALGWFLGTVVEFVVAGWVTALIIKE